MQKTFVSMSETSYGVEFSSRELLKQNLFSKLYTHPEILSKMAEQFGGSSGPENGEADSGVTEVVPEVKVVEKTTFDVELSAFDASKKIKIIKEMKTMLGLGLKEAKEFVEKCPNTVKQGLTKEEAEELQKKLAEIGCTITIK